MLHGPSRPAYGLPGRHQPMVRRVWGRVTRRPGARRSSGVAAGQAVTTGCSGRSWLHRRRRSPAWPTSLLLAGPCAMRPSSSASSSRIPGNARPGRAQKGRETHRCRLAREHAQRPTPEPAAATPIPLPTEAPPVVPPPHPAPTPPLAETAAVHGNGQAVQAVQPPLASQPSLQEPAQTPSPQAEPGPRFNWRSLLRLLHPGKAAR